MKNVLTVPGVLKMYSVSKRLKDNWTKKWTLNKILTQ